MNILAIDTTADRIRVAAEIGGARAVRTGERGFREHNAALLGYVEETLASLGAELKDVDVFAAVRGPGSFTGIRLGVAAVNAMAYVSGKKAVALDALVLAAADAPRPSVVAIDAGRGNYYAAFFEEGDCPVWEKFVTESELAAYNITVKAQMPVSGDVMLDAAAANAAAGRACGAIEPVYLRKSQAERMKDGD